MLKKTIVSHRVSVGDAVVSDNDVDTNHVAKRNGLTGIGLEPVFSIYSTHLSHGLRDSCPFFVRVSFLTTWWRSCLSMEFKSSREPCERLGPWL